MSQSLHNTYFYELRGRQTQGPPRAAHTLATPLVAFTKFAKASEKSIVTLWILSTKNILLTA